MNEQKSKVLRERRTQHILQAAFKVFVRKGFEWSTMQDVAHEAELGVATVFRYFPKKNKLIIAVIRQILEQSLPTFEKILQSGGTSYEKFEKVLNHYIKLSEPELLDKMKLLEAFETYVAFSQEPLEDIAQYYEAYANITNTIAQMIREGLEDKSVREDISIEATMSAMANVFGIFGRKLSFFESARMGTLDFIPTDQAMIVKNIFLDYLKPKH
ncbi:hypothetical protein AEA09_03340 [Lysinibacillus contaminans]|uniref:HTH tetR-type domain-containing protein n=1 Tax=Lysinibacillus contaminans TaxID=1293441 RepID=A0ABR5JYE7_9BACI|nr:TetR/AcrR family transcriptional regulator [Lysinibacillus contaminans]KOS67687.1 hypothetical protein AEA09_03340 [Lysinibacillus contaminans]